MISKKSVLTFLGWIVSIGLIVNLLLRIDLNEMAARLVGANWWLLIAAAIVNLAVMVAKTFRWQWIIYPEKRVGFGNAFKAMMIGYAGNNIFPARGGDILRIHLLGRWEELSRASLVSMTALEKLFDGILLLILFFAASSFSTFPTWMHRGSAIVATTVVILALVCFALRSRYKKNIHRDRDLMGWLERILTSLGQGMSILERRGLLASTFAISFVLFFLMVLTLFLCQQAFAVSVPWGVPLLAFLGVNLSMLLPSAPSSAGTFEFAAVLVYTSFGMPMETALGLAIAYHLVQVIPVTIGGAILYLRSTRKEKTKTLRVYALKALEHVILFFCVKPYNAVAALVTLVLLALNGMAKGPCRRKSSS